MSRGSWVRVVAPVCVVGTAVLALAGGASARVLSRAPSVVQHPMHKLGQVGNNIVTSSNWSGYAVEDAAKFTDVAGTWVQPAVSCTSNGAQYSSFWAGLDGYSSSSVEQLGTDSDCVGRNRPSYYAWYEMYPAGSVSISTSQYPVKPGDTLSAEVSVNGTQFTLSLRSSEGWHFTTTQTGSGLAQSSAELIAESPEICGWFSCRLASLANFGTVNFSGAQAAVNGGADQPFGTFTANSGPHEIIADTNSGAVKAQPSPLSATGNAFSISWKHS